MAREPILLSKLPYRVAYTDRGTARDHSAWLVGPVGQSRDSDTGERSNWHAATSALATLDPDGLDHEIHRFGHWACGWVEEIATRPGSPCATLADTMRAQLADYPILNDDHHGALEHSEACEAWPQTWRDLRADIEPIIAGMLADADGSCDVGAIDAFVSDRLNLVTDDQAWEACGARHSEILDGRFRFGRSDKESCAKSLIAAGYFADGSPSVDAG